MRKIDQFRLGESGKVELFQDGSTFHRLTTVDEDFVKRHTQSIRELPGAPLAGIQCAFSIPEALFEVLVKTEPALFVGDSEERRKAWLAWAKTPLGKTCMVKGST